MQWNKTVLKHELCENGDHDLVEIYRNLHIHRADVVRWCRNCGSVVVDAESLIGSLDAGAVMEMKNPNILKDYNELGEMLDILRKRGVDIFHKDLSSSLEESDDDFLDIEFMVDN